MTGNNLYQDLYGTQDYDHYRNGIHELASKATNARQRGLHQRVDFHARLAPRVVLHSIDRSMMAGAGLRFARTFQAWSACACGDTKTNYATRVHVSTFR